MSCVRDRERRFVVERKKDGKWFTHDSKWTDEPKRAEYYKKRDSAGRRSEDASRTREDGFPEPVKVREVDFITEEKD